MRYRVDHSKIHIHARACNILYTVYVYDDILYVCDLGRDRFVRLYLYIIKIVFCFVLTWIPVIFGREDCNLYVMLGLNKGFKKIKKYGFEVYLSLPQEKKHILAHLNLN